MDIGSKALYRHVVTGATALGVALLLAACSAPATPYTLDATFTTCGATGPTGPDQAACDSAYAGTDLEGSVSVASGIQSFTVVRSGTYRVISEGAQGASADSSFDGGRGARAQADVEMNAGDVLRIVVGQAGSGVDSGDNGGGGGGSFVVAGAGTPLVIAGGGGGTRVSASQDGCNANTGTFGIVGSGASPTGSCDPKGGSESFGGAISSSSYGSAGAGFFGNGANDSTYGFGGRSWANGMLGGDWNDDCPGGEPAEGGFGGGGSGSGCFGGGGGGGYSGGDGGWIAGGGGSFVAASATNVTIVLGAGIGVGDGVVTLEYRGN